MKLLQLSGGLDSLACLLLLQREPGLNVLTVQTDGGYPGVLLYLLKLAERFPAVTFHRRTSDRELKAYGQPVDVVPLRWTVLGQLARGGADVRYQDTYSCCQRGIWLPLARASAALGASTIYRGQRDDDRLKGPYHDGDTIAGVPYRFPIAVWSRPQVLAFVREQAADLMPPGYDQGERSSRDCMDCSAYLEDNEARLRHLPPALFKRMETILVRWREDVLTELG